MSRRSTIAFAAWLALLLRCDAAPPAPLAEGERRAILDAITAEAKAVAAQMEREPGSIALYSRRGDCRLFLSDWKGAIADFEKMIALDPAEDAPHWRLGIAYHFAGEFAKSARQFQKYHAHDSRDRENGIWHFLAQVQTVGIDAARKQMLRYEEFDREPFPTLYEMFGGRKTGDAVFEEIRVKGLSKNETVVFFANYYVGLNEELLGRRERALELLGKAVASEFRRRGDNGPPYMWQVARLHYEKLAAAAK